MNLKSIAVTLTVIFTLVSISGCSSMKPISSNASHQELQQTLNPGDKVIIETKDNTKHKWVIDSVSNDGINASGQHIPYDNIKSLKKERIDAVKTTGAVAGGVVIYYMIATLVVLGAIL